MLNLTNVAANLPVKWCNHAESEFLKFSPHKMERLRHRPVVAVGLDLNNDANTQLNDNLLFFSVVQCWSEEAVLVDNGTDGAKLPIRAHDKHATGETQMPRQSRNRPGT